MNYNPSQHSVNEKTALLTLNSNKVPTVQLTNGTTFTLPDHTWSRWYLKTHFKTLNGTDEAIQWYLQADPMKYDPINHLLSSPRKYQILALNRMKMSNCALWLDMGLGKTFISIAFALWMYQQNLGNVSLILCPPSVFVTWKDDVKKLVHPGANARFEILHGTKKADILSKLRTAPLNTPTFLVTTYETLESIREKIQSLPVTSIFFDESSKIKNWESGRTQSAHALATALYNSRRFCLSGTPSTKSPLGLYSQYEILGRGFSGSVAFQAFEKRYAISKTFMTVQLPHGRITSLEDGSDSIEHWLNEHFPPHSNGASYKALGFTFSPRPQNEKQIKILGWHKRNVAYINQDELHRITQTHAYSLYKEEVLTELPPKTRTKRIVELSADQRKAYREILETSRTQIGKIPFSFHDSSSPMAKLHQIANGYIIHQDKTITFFDQQPKLRELEQIIEELGDQKLVMWSPFRPQIDQVARFIREDLEMKCFELHGGIPPKDREGIVHAFQNGEGHLVGNPAVGGLGLNLVSSCVELFLANWYTPDIRSQAEDRLWRIGQTKPVTVMDLVCRGTLEPAILRQALGEISLERKLISMTVLLGGDN